MPGESAEVDDPAERKERVLPTGQVNLFHRGLLENKVRQ